MLELAQSKRLVRQIVLDFKALLVVNFDFQSLDKMPQTLNIPGIIGAGIGTFETDFDVIQDRITAAFVNSPLH